MRGLFVSALPLLAGFGLVASAPAAAQQYVPGNSPVTYHLHGGSTYQSGCWGACACALSDPEPLRGTFELRLVNIGDVTDFYQINRVDWRVRDLFGQPFNRVISGAGTFLAGQSPFADHQYVDLDLSISPPTPTWASSIPFSGGGTRSVEPPVIDIAFADNTTGCPGVRMRLVATWYESDWDASGQLGPQDLFDFLTDFFLGRADYTMNGATSVQDLFEFLGDWFSGV